MSLKNILKRALMSVSATMHNDYGSKILYYHDVFRTINHKALDADIHMGTPFELFRQHIETIRKEGYEIVPDITESKGQVTIMFDDGFRGIYECKDFFFKNNILPTVFLPAGYVGDVGHGLLSKSEIIELQSHGFRFECHGWSHRPLNEFNDDELNRELVDSRKFLSDFLNKDVTSLCMPLGFFSPHVLKRIKEAGYTKIYSCIPGTISDRPFGLLTRNLCQYASPSEVSLILRGGNEILKQRYAKMHCHA